MREYVSSLLPHVDTNACVTHGLLLVGVTTASLCMQEVSHSICRACLSLGSHGITQEASEKRMSGPYPKEPSLNAFITGLPSAALKNSPGDSDVLISLFFFSYKMGLTVSELPRTYLNTNIQITFSIFMSYIFYLNVVRFSSCMFNGILLL